MRGVQEHRRRTAHPLESTGCGDRGESGPDGVDVELALRTGAEERLHRGQRDRGVVGLVFAVQRQEHLRVHPAEPLQFEQLAADGGLSTQHRELRVLAGHRRVGAHRLRQQGLHRLGRLPGQNRDRVGRDEVFGLFGDDAGLLGRDLADGVTQVVGMIQADRRDDRDGGIDDVGRVPPPTEAHLDDRDVDRGVGEGGERHRGDDFELAHRRPAGLVGLLVDELDERFDLAVGVDVGRRADRLAVDGDAFHRGLQVRAGGAAGASMERGEQRVDHPGHRRLAVRAADVDARVTTLRGAQDLHQCRDARGAGLDLGLRPALIEQVLDLQQCGDLVRRRLGCAHGVGSASSRAVMRSTSSSASC